MSSNGEGVKSSKFTSLREIFLYAILPRKLSFFAFHSTTPVLGTKRNVFILMGQNDLPPKQSFLGNIFRAANEKNGKKRSEIKSPELH